MRTTPKRRRRFFSSGAVALTLIAAALGAGTASAAAPSVAATWSSAIFSSTARLQAQINPNGATTTYHFDYITKAAYEANLAAAKEPFAGASRIPPGADANIGAGSGTLGVLQFLSGLLPDTAYRYRVLAKNSGGTTPGATLTFITQSSAGTGTLADGRGWEMVSPIDKNGGEVSAPGQIAKGGVLQAAAQGSAITYGSAASFAGGQGAPPASQYLAIRGGGGWSSQNLTAPIFAGSYDAEDTGAPFQLFSADLARGILLNGDHCRGEGSGCAVANPPLAGTDAPAGYQNYYLREAGYTALLGSSNAGFLSLEPKDFDLRFAGSSPDLRHPVLSTCAALSANATQAPLGEGCDPTKQNLYQYSSGTGLTLLNLKPGDTTGTPGATLASQAGAVSEDGSRVYFTLEGNLYLRDGAQTKAVDEDAGGGGSFETASSDGSVAFFTKAEHLWRYLAATDAATDITPSGGLKGVLGASADGSHVYYQDASALKLWNAGATTTVGPGAEAAEASDWPPATGTSRVSPDGSKLLFTSKLPLSEYDNTDLNKGTADSEVFLYDAAAGAGTLSCVSCNPTLGRPVGSSSIPGSIPNGSAKGSTNSYKPRSLSANGRRVFFDSNDTLALADTDNAPDAYQWEAQGEGSCTRQGGCISLISDGRSAGGGRFIDASADGSDAFFLTTGSLVKADPGAQDLYDARVLGGFGEATEPLACEGDACQPLPSPPVDPTLTTLLTGPGNPPVRFPKEKKKGCKKGFVKHKGKCVKKAAKGKAKTKSQHHQRSGR